MSIVTATQICIVDLNDPVVSAVAPAVPVKDMIWLDTGKTPSVYKHWTGTAWEIINDTKDLEGKISDLQDEMIQQGGAAPTAPTSGMLWLDTSSGIELKRYTYVDEDAGYSWITVSDGELSDELESQYHDLLLQIQTQRNSILGEAANIYETKENVATLKREMQSAIEQQAESIWLGFRETTTELVDANGELAERVGVIESGVTVEPGAKVTLSASNASTRMEIDPNGLKIVDKGGASLAEFTSDGATVPRIRIGEQMSLGNLMWAVHGNGTSSIMAN